MNISDINQRLERIYHSISLLKNNDLSDIKTDIGISDNLHYAHVDFSVSKTEAELKNSVYSLISNIASMKDHLKDWCSKNQKSFEGDNLINFDKNVAIIHDLWNIDKHPAYSVPRSGSLPKIIDLQQSLSISAGTEPGSYSAFSFYPVTGQTKSEVGGSGSQFLVVSGTVINERKEFLGDLVEICSNAITAWENESKKLGIGCIK